jgi:nucleoid-associated protein YgaU
MLGFLKTQQGVWALAATVVLGTAGTWYAFSPSRLPSAPATPQAVATPAQPAAPNPGDEQSTKTKAAALDATDKSEAAAPVAAVQPPEFDIVRVEPSGDSVIAGRGSPGATISLVEGGATLASAVADANGEVVFLPPPLPPGEHVLALRSILAGAAPVLSAKSVAVIVPQAKNAPSPAVAASNVAPSAVPAAGGAVNPQPQPAATTPSPTPAKSVPEVAIRTAEAEVGGSFFATGNAPPGSQNWVYLNGAFLAKVIADLNGLWSVRVEKGMAPGNYVVRADEVEPQSGKVVARAEVSFNFPAPPAPSADGATAEQPAKSSGSGSSAAQPPTSPAPVVAGTPASGSTPTIVKEVRTATVIRGDSLWRISRKMLGRGIRYTQIYEANASQIRNPRLVFPGQIFVMPSDPG